MANENIYPKTEGETIGTYGHRLATAFTNPNSELWKTYRKHTNLSKKEWAAAYPKPDNVFPFPKTLWDINCGHCESFLELLELNFPGGEEEWLDTLAINDTRIQPKGFNSWSKSKQEQWCQSYEAPSHCVYFINGLYHDSENPTGVADWTNLETWLHRNLTRSDWIQLKTKNQKPSL